MVEYRETFLSEMKSLLLYFIEFFDNKLILSKFDPNKCTIGGSDWRIIIIIKYDKNIFSTDDGHCQEI